MTSSWWVTKLPDWRGPAPAATGVLGGAGEDASLTSFKDSSEKLLMNELLSIYYYAFVLK